jgi:hypothetical protein
MKMNLVKSFAVWRESVIESKPKFVWQAGVLGFGISFGLVWSLVLVNSHDIANHPLWEKSLTVVGMTLIAGPIAGWLWGQWMWAIKPTWLRSKKQQTSDAARIAELERRVADLEQKNRREA